MDDTIEEMKRSGQFIEKRHKRKMRRNYDGLDKRYRMWQLLKQEAVDHRDDPAPYRSKHTGHFSVCAVHINPDEWNCKCTCKDIDERLDDASRAIRELVIAKRKEEDEMLLRHGIRMS